MFFLLPLGCSILCALGIFAPSPDTYEWIRWGVCFTAFFVSLSQALDYPKIWTWALIIFGVIYNPIFPIRWKREEWQIVDGIAAAFFLGVAVVFIHASRARWQAFFSAVWEDLRRWRFWWDLIVVLSVAVPAFLLVFAVIGSAVCGLMWICGKTIPFDEMKTGYLLLSGFVLSVTAIFGVGSFFVEKWSLPRKDEEISRPDL